ncbi:S26 family signal peptidase [Sphaerisporangium sp. NPDC004334]
MNPWLSTAVVAVFAGIVIAMVELRRRFRLVTVYGVSMEPTLSTGDRVLVRRCGPAGLSRGDIVLVDMDKPFGWPPGRPILLPKGSQSAIIKRLAALPGEPLPDDLDARPGVLTDAVVPDGHVVVVGDNRRASVDSRQHGYVPVRFVVGKVLRRVETRGSSKVGTSV